MPIDRLDHYAIRTADLDATRHFYTEIMGLEVGPRPAFDFPGVWLYRDGAALVHVVGIDPNDPSGLLAYLGEKATAQGEGSGRIDHIAFIGSDLPAVREGFVSQGIAFRERTVPSLHLHQIFLEDPNGITIEINFPV
jgi:catechol 2,3-dioxygenase-like lactoylglutathione lyase family enzyme